MAKIVNIISLSGLTSVDLGYIASPIDGIVTNTGGEDATIPLADSVNAGLLSPGDFDIIQNIEVDILNIITQTITDGDTLHSPSGNAVFDALFLKANDADVVHKAGAETIIGKKTFNPTVDSGAIAINIPAATLNPDALTITLGGNPSGPGFIGGTVVTSTGSRNTAFYFSPTGAGISNKALAYFRKIGTSGNFFAELLDEALGVPTFTITDTGVLNATTLIKIGGTALQFLKADGSVDSNTYLTTESDTLQSVTTRGSVTTTNISALSFIKSGGLATQYLMANGSVSTIANIASGILATSIVDGDTTHAPDGNSVFDALTLKANDASVVHKAGNEIITGTKTVTTPQNTNGFIVDMFDVNNTPSGSVPDAISTHTRGHNGPTANLVAGHFAMMEANKNAGFISYALPTTTPAIQTTNSKGFQSIFDDLLGNNIHFEGKSEGSVVFKVTDLGDVTGKSFIKLGGLSTQILMADGSVSTAATISSAIVSPTIVDGDTTHAPSGNAVFDALTLKVSSIAAGSNISINSLDPQNPIISSTPATSAGIFDRVYFTGQVASVVGPGGSNYDTIRNGKGSVASVSLVSPAIAASTKVYFTNDLIGPAQVIAGTLPIGNFSSFISVLPSSATALKRFTIEVFLCNNAGVIIPQAGPPSTDANVFYAGKNTVVILDSGDLTLPTSNTTIGLSGYLSSIVNVAVGQRFRYHISVARGAGGGAQTMNVNIGSTWNSYIEAPIPVTTSTVINMSLVPGATATDALNALNSSIPVDSNLVHKTGAETITGVKTWTMPVDSGAIAINLPHSVAISPDAIAVALNGSDGVGGGKIGAMFVSMAGSNNVGLNITPAVGATGNVGFLYVKPVGSSGNSFLELWQNGGITPLFKVDDFGTLFAVNGNFNEDVIAQNGVFNDTLTAGVIVSNSDITAQGNLFGNNLFGNAPAPMFIRPLAGQPLELQTDGTTRLKVNPSTGNILINQTIDSPTYKLQVTGDSNFTGTILATQVSTQSLAANTLQCDFLTVTETVGASWFSTNNDGDQMSFRTFETGASFGFYNDGILRTIIKYDGSIGIGTASPSNRLTINTTTNNDGIGFHYADGIGYSKIGVQFDTLSDEGNVIFFNVSNAASSPITRMTLRGNGHVGIGTAAPPSRLSVAPTVDHTPGATPTLRIMEGSANPDFGLGLSFYYSGSNWTGKIQSVQGGTPGPISLNPEGGNALIGGVADNGYKLQVYGDIFCNGTGVFASQVISRAPLATNAPVGATDTTVSNFTSLYTGSTSVDQSDVNYYPMLTAVNVLTGIGYTNSPSFGFMRPTGDFGQSGQAIIQLSGDGTPLVRWRFKANGSFETPTYSEGTMTSNFGPIKTNSGVYLGTAQDYEQSVILLHEIGNGVGILRNCVNGTIEGHRGDVGAGTMAQIYNIHTAAGNGVIANMNTINAYTVSDQYLYTCMYGGRKYICVRNTDVPAKSFVFKGDYQSQSGGTALQLVIYNNTQTGVVNAEINSSLTTYAALSPISFGGDVNIKSTLTVNDVTTLFSNLNVQSEILAEGYVRCDGVVGREDGTPFPIIGTNSFIYFCTGPGNLERMRIDQNGTVLINNKNNPSNQKAFRVFGNASTRISLQEMFNNASILLNSGVSSLLFCQDPNDGHAHLQITNDTGSAASNFYINAYGGATQIGPGGNVLALQIAGNTQYTGTLINASDRRLKKNIKPLENSLDRVLRTQGVYFDRVDNDSVNQIGFIAQDLEKEFPELVVTEDTEEGLKSVNYVAMVAVLVEAIKELKAEVDELRIILTSK